MITFQCQDLGLPENEAGMHIFPRDLVFNDPKNKGRQTSVCLWVELQVQESPGLASIVARGTFDDLESRSSCMTYKAVMQVRRKLVLHQSVVRDMIDRLFQFLVAFDHISEIYVALSDRIQEAASPFLPS